MSNSLNRYFKRRTPSNPNNKFCWICNVLKNVDRESLKAMLVCGIDLNMQNAEMKTPLMFVAEGSSVEAFRIMRDFGFNIDTPNSHGTTPLMWAAVVNNYRMIKKLTDRGANVNARDCNDATALMKALQNGCDNAVIALLKAGADPCIGENVNSINRQMLVSRFNNPTRVTQIG